MAQERVSSALFGPGSPPVCARSWEHLPLLYTHPTLVHIHHIHIHPTLTQPTHTHTPHAHCTPDISQHIPIPKGHIICMYTRAHTCTHDTHSPHTQCTHTHTIHTVLTHPRANTHTHTPYTSIPSVSMPTAGWRKPGICSQTQPGTG